MSILATDIRFAKVQDVNLTEDELIVELDDGRSMSVPLGWYPRLLHGTLEERNNWRLIGGGAGIHWPELDEDISIEHLITGIPSGENQQSLQNWLSERNIPSE